MSLFDAYKEGKVDNVRALISAGADVNIRGICNFVTLHYASTEEIAKELLALM